MKRGYKSAIEEPEYQRCAESLRSLHDLKDELLAEVESIQDRQITWRELIRDLNFTMNGIDLLNDIGVLGETVTKRNGRGTFSLKQALKCKAQFPGLTRPKARQRKARERVDSMLKRAIRNGCDVDE